MSWKETDMITERMKFIMRFQDGERMSDLCKEFSISRKTGYKLLERFESKGSEGLFDERRNPLSHPNKTPLNIENLIIKLKETHKTWGAIKLREYLMRKYSELSFPSRNTFYNILLKHNLVHKRVRRNLFNFKGTNLRSTSKSNDLWGADYKGRFKLKNGCDCHALTITDHESRCLLSCTALESVKEGSAISVFESVFEKYGLPLAIRTDNGVPFASSSILGLSKLSVWWLRLGIEIERIQPGHPEQNGRHERMHLTLKRDLDLSRNPAANILKQQEDFDRFIYNFNTKRPHQALKNETPGSRYTPSDRKLPKTLKEIDYNICDRVRKIGKKGELYIDRKYPIFIGKALQYQPIGITQVDDRMHRLQFMDILLGHYDEENNTFSKVNEFIKL